MTPPVLRPATLEVPEMVQLPATLEVPEMVQLPPLPQETLAGAHATTLEWVKVAVATSQDLRKAISELERFTGEVGELNHFLKGGDRLVERIAAKERATILDEDDANALRAALVCRVKRNILNHIQADEDTAWPIVKERLKKAYGNGRWSPEEDIFQMFREMKTPRQTNGQFAATLLTRYKQLTEKMRETLNTNEVNASMAFLATVLKVQLAKETGRREGFPKERAFVDCAQDLMDASAREEDGRMEIKETGWNRVPYRRPQPSQMSGRRKEQTYRNREKTSSWERRPGQNRSKTNPRKDDRKCHGCGKGGHLVAQCPRTRCFECGTEGHIARQCPYIYSRRDRQRDEPMEVNAQRIWRRRRAPSESTGTPRTSESEGEEERLSSSGGEGVNVDKRSGRKRTVTSTSGRAIA